MIPTSGGWEQSNGSGSRARAKEGRYAKTEAWRHPTGFAKRLGQDASGRGSWCKMPRYFGTMPPQDAAPTASGAPYDDCTTWAALPPTAGVTTNIVA